MSPVEDETLSSQEQDHLLRIARRAIENHLRNKADPSTQDAETRKFTQRRGVFVSLHMHGELRGCIGVFAPPTTLCHTIQEMAVAAACEDPRFPPVELDEMKDVDIEISVLSPLKEVSSPGDVIVGVHGIHITKGMYRGVLLPQVATEYGWDRETFLDHTCIKAGLPPGTWRKGGVKIEVFTAQVFGEKKGGHAQ